VRLVWDLSASAADDVPSLLLLHLVELFLARLINGHDLLLQLLQLLLELGDHVVQIVLVALVLVQLFVQEHDLRLVTNFLPLVQRLLQHDTVSLVFQLAELLEIGDGDDTAFKKLLTATSLVGLASGIVKRSVPLLNLIHLHLGDVFLATGGVYGDLILAHISLLLKVLRM